MIIKTLLEDETISDDLLTEHGLSLYIETKLRKIIFDTGKTNKFIVNAQTLDVNLKDADMAILSHGHYDHGGGLLDFLDVNKEAFVYIQKGAFTPHGSIKENEKIRDAGIDTEIEENERVKLVEEDIFFDEDLILFSHIEGEELVPRGNDTLLMKKYDLWEKDDFKHEQNLIIREGRNRVLIVGCSHRGIVNILKQAQEISDLPITHVIGGFHLYDLDLNDSLDMEFLKKVSDELVESGATFYTGHCTGRKQYYKLKEIMGDKINELSTGIIITI
ncbi:MAG: MBL fold metallo-hydrolase [Gudongella sp.]|nr:MBL fold metallo-hydrolase [Gudongella sp.]